jgi:hypothetical protein
MNIQELNQIEIEYDILSESCDKEARYILEHIR